MPRWFRFSLRTLFVVVTVFACWLGWQIHLVQSRRAFHGEAHCFQTSNIDIYPPPPGIPFYRRWLGDKEIQRIDLVHESQQERAKALFPEARWILWIPPDFSLRGHAAEAKPAPAD